MNDITKLTNCEIDVQLEENIVIKVPALKVKELKKFAKIKDEDVQMEFMTEKIEEILLSNYPESTPEQRADVSVKYALPIIEGVMKATGIDDNKLKKPE